VPVRILLSLILLSSLISSSFAEEFGVIDIDYPEVSTDPALVFATSGDVFELDLANKELVEEINKAMLENKSVEFIFENSTSKNLSFTDRRTIKKVKVSEDALIMSSVEPSNLKNNNSILFNTYITDFDNLDIAQKYFNTMRTDTTNKSQCYNRAHVWSWELYSKRYQGRRVQPGKVWIFFTKKYIREYKHKWWFHIAPFVRVNGEDKIIDRSFTSMPVSTKEWSDLFILSKTKCTQINKYSSYVNNQYATDCFIIKSSVYYWQPFQLENLEKDGDIPSEWNTYELKRAYRNAIGYFTTYPPLRN